MAKKAEKHQQEPEIDPEKPIIEKTDPEKEPEPQTLEEDGPGTPPTDPKGGGTR